MTEIAITCAVVAPNSPALLDPVFHGSRSVTHSYGFGYSDFPGLPGSPGGSVLIHVNTFSTYVLLTYLLPT